MHKNDNFFLKIFWLLTMELVATIPTCKKQTHFQQNNESAYNVLSTIPEFQSIERVSYHTDTTSRGNTLLYYSNGDITRLYVDGNNRYKMQLPYFAHENWHHHNENTKYKKFADLNPKEYVKLCAWDEISANLCAILTARYEYIYSKNKQQVIKNYENTYMKFYFDAIKNKSIKPTAKEISTKECAFLINGVTDMWIKTYWPMYINNFVKRLSLRINHLKPTDNSAKYYKYLRNQMLNIGGINFSAYLKTDIQPNTKLLLTMEQIYKDNCFKQDWEDIATAIINHEQQLSALTQSQQEELLKHIAITTKLKKILADFDPQTIISNPQIIINNYNSTKQSFNNSKYFNNWLYHVPRNDFCLYYGNKEFFHRCVIDLYKYQDINMATIIGTKNIFSDNFDDNILPIPLPNTQNTPQNNIHHKSETQYIDLPNFSQPILVNPTKIQQYQIKKTIRAFEDFPQVLKECDTQAQIKYLQAHPKQR